ncbi:MAG TPA: hypothetical protein VFQ79_16060, partial [Bryobacteraceae bacterium]|nr:hypothetical protein [Bryobacteraceae bacterium]
HFENFCNEDGIKYTGEISLTTLTDFRAGRRVTVKDGEEVTEREITGSTSGKELETMRAFCAFAKKHGCIGETTQRKCGRRKRRTALHCHSRPRKWTPS